MKPDSKPSLGLIEYLFNGYIPDNTTLKIERSSINNYHMYVYRLTYISKKSGRTMCMVAKGDSIPFSRDRLFDFYLRQLTLSPTEAAREFSRLYFLERRARQDEFLFNAGKTSAGLADQAKNSRVSGTMEHKDTLSYEKYI